MATIIGVTVGEIRDQHYPWAPAAYGQAKTYTNTIISAKGVPLVLPITDKKRPLRAMYEKLDGLLLTGGSDINPKLYGQKPRETTKNISTQRDNYEKQLIMWALEDKKPILAICRGMQLLNVICGGDLYQHIASELPEAEDHVKSSNLKDMEHLAHVLNIAPNSKLAHILGLTKIRTNAHHHQAVKHLAPNLKAVAWTDDKIVEALESKDTANFIIAVQSHPEALVKRAEKAWLNLFISFVQAAANSK